MWLKLNIHIWVNDVSGQKNCVNSETLIPNSIPHFFRVKFHSLKEGNYWFKNWTTLAFSLPIYFWSLLLKSLTYFFFNTWLLQGWNKSNSFPFILCRYNFYSWKCGIHESPSFKRNSTRSRAKCNPSEVEKWIRFFTEKWIP